MQNNHTQDYILFNSCQIQWVAVLKPKRTACRWIQVVATLSFVCQHGIPLGYRSIRSAFFLWSGQSIDYYCKNSRHQPGHHQDSPHARAKSQAKHQYSTERNLDCNRCVAPSGVSIVYDTSYQGVQTAQYSFYSTYEYWYLVQYDRRFSAE